MERWQRTSDRCPDRTSADGIGARRVTIVRTNARRGPSRRCSCAATVANCVEAIASYRLDKAGCSSCASLGVLAGYYGVMRLIRIDTIRQWAVRGSGRRVVAMLATGAVALAAAPAAAQAGTANRGLPGAGPNPIAHMAWAAPRNDGPWSAYESATGANRALLGRLAAQPRAVWLGW